MRYIIIVTLIFCWHISAIADSITADSLVQFVIKKIENDNINCPKYSCLNNSARIKYDKNFEVKEMTVTEKITYQKGDEISEKIISIEKDGEPLEAEKIKKEIKKLLEEWEKEKKKAEEKNEGHRGDHVEPISLNGYSDYNFSITGTADTAFYILGGFQDLEGLDNESVSIEEWHEFECYILKAESKEDDSKHINATYWIEKESFSILKKTFTPAKLPTFVDRLDFQIINQIIINNEQRVTVSSKFELKGKAGFLFFKGRFGVQETFSDCQCDDSIADSLFEKRYFLEEGIEE